ncbi:MAG: antitoxin [Candidatus Aureabacteria bacterium]|nr:antitoxin [Candidatus Auribacterota bacterium]
MKKVNSEEKEILESYDKNEWKPVKKLKIQRKRYQKYAQATFKKDKRLNIRISSKDLEGIQKKAIEEGLPYQTLISSIIHKYVSGRL